MSHPFEIIAKRLGCTPAEVGDMGWDQLAEALKQAQREMDQANANIAWLDAAIEVMETPDANA